MVGRTQAAVLEPLVLSDTIVSIEPVSMRALDDFHEYSMKPALYRYFEFEPFASIEDSRRYLEKLISRSAGGSAQYWFIRWLADDKVVGSIGIHSLDQKRRSAEIGYGVSPDYWGRGVFPAAARLLLEYAFTSLELHRIVARTAADNAASIRSLRKLRFRYEGLMRDYYRFPDGSWHDATLMSRLRSD